MSVFEIIGGILLLAASLIIIVLVILQEVKQQGMETITGSSSDSYYGKNKGRTRDALLAKITKIAAIAFFVFVLLANLFQVFGSSAA